MALTFRKVIGHVFRSERSCAIKQYILKLISLTGSGSCPLLKALQSQGNLLTCVLSILYGAWANKLGRLPRFSVAFNYTDWSLSC